MDINIPVFACLQFVSGHEKFSVQLFVQFVENQAPLGGNQRAVRISVALVTDVADGLAFGVHLVHHMDKIMFVIAVVPVAFCHRGVDRLQSPFHNVVHLLYGDLLFAQGLCLVLRVFAEKTYFLLRKLIHDTGCGFIHRTNNLLHIKLLSRAVFFNYIHHCFTSHGSH